MVTASVYNEWFGYARTRAFCLIGDSARRDPDIASDVALDALITASDSYTGIVAWKTHLRRHVKWRSLDWYRRPRRPCVSVDDVAECDEPCSRACVSFVDVDDLAHYLADGNSRVEQMFLLFARGYTKADFARIAGKNQGIARDLLKAWRSTALPNFAVKDRSHTMTCASLNLWCRYHGVDPAGWPGHPVISFPGDSADGPRLTPAIQESPLEAIGQGGSHQPRRSPEAG